MIKLVFLAAVVVLYFLWTHAVVEKTSVSSAISNLKAG
jgi:hypothetical protein